MKDPENGNDAKNDEGKGDADDMSLADLLGGDVSDDTSEPKRVEHRDDEPDSGMVNLAKMVADSSVEAAKVPSIIPPPTAAGDQTGRTDTTGQVAAGPAVVQEKKSSGPIYALIAVVAIAAVIVVIVMLTGKDEAKGDDPATLALLAKLEQIEKEQQEQEEKMARLETERREAEEAKAAAEAKLAGMRKADGGELSAEEQAKMEEIQKEIDEAKAKEEELAKAAAEAEQKAEEAKKKAAETKAKSGKKTSGAKVASGGKKDDGASSGGKTSADDLLDKPSKKKEPAKKDTGKKGGADELDSLLGGGGKKKEGDAPKEDKPAASNLPKNLSQAQVKAGMGPVQVRAQAMCSKYSTGTVQIQVVIGGNGRVKSANPIGAFANSTAGKCVAMQARTAKFPKFSDSSQKVLYPISLK